MTMIKEPISEIYFGSLCWGDARLDLQEYLPLVKFTLSKAQNKTHGSKAAIHTIPDRLSSLNPESRLGPLLRRIQCISQIEYEASYSNIRSGPNSCSACPDDNPRDFQFAIFNLRF